MGMPSMPELLVILAIVVLMFGAKKIPDLAKGLGKGIKDFREAIKDDEKTEETKEVASTSTTSTSADAKPVDIKKETNA